MSSHTCKLCAMEESLKDISPSNPNSRYKDGWVDDDVRGIAIISYIAGAVEFSLVRETILGTMCSKHLHQFHSYAIAAVDAIKSLVGEKAPSAAPLVRKYDPNAS
jgi:hypothetical protein